MEFADPSARRMVRAFDDRPVERGACSTASSTRPPGAVRRQHPGLGLRRARGRRTPRFWDVTLPAGAAGAFRWQQLLDAPGRDPAAGPPQAYVDRYAEPDKAATGLGRSPTRWPVPYWQVDTAFATMLLLLAAVDAGLGALFFGVFRNGEKLLADLGVPGGYELIGAMALGYPRRRRARPLRRTAPPPPRRDRAPGRLAGRSVPALSPAPPANFAFRQGR